jgi:hypothetical protein
MADALLDEITERFDYAKSAWQEVRDEGAKDMRYVAGDPWDDDDKKQRKDRPMIAPDELAQYRNQVINQLRANPRGMRFSPRGNGASKEGALFYQNKARETEYRSHAKIAYITAAENAIQRSYGFCRVSTRYESPRSVNQEIWIDDFPDPDMVLPDPDAKRPDSSDMQYCFVLQWSEQRELLRTRKSKFESFGGFSASHPSWIQDKKILEAEYWKIATRKRKLVLVQPLAASVAPSPRLIAPQPTPMPPPQAAFVDELEKWPAGTTVLRELREVDYPTVKMYLTNGLEILHEQDWPGKFIPIVSCYGPILWVPEGGQIKRKILSMTRFQRAPWKALCYACSQELEILGQVPKASVLATPAQLKGFEKDWQEAPYIPKAYLYYNPTDAQGKPIDKPERMNYLQADNLAALQVVKESYRRAIQAATASNFLPTDAQKRNEKSGVALDKIDQAASTGSYHFVSNYDDTIRRVAEIYEDLCDKIHDYKGETGVIEADGTAMAQAINDPSNPKAINTRGDYGVTVSTGPSSDSEQAAVSDFTDVLVGQLERIAGVAGPKVAAAVLARAIRMRNLGPQGDQLADLIEPPDFKTKDGQPPDPRMLSLQAQVQHLTQLLQQAAREKEAKVVEQEGKFRIEQMKVETTSADKAADREVKLAIAELSARIERMALFLEERHRLGLRLDAAADRLHERLDAHRDRGHDALEAARDRTHDRLLADATHEHALEQGDQGVQGQLAVQAAAPQPENGASA